MSCASIRRPGGACSMNSTNSGPGKAEARDHAASTTRWSCRHPCHPQRLLGPRGKLPGRYAVVQRAPAVEDLYATVLPAQEQIRPATLYFFGQQRSCSNECRQDRSPLVRASVSCQSSGALLRRNALIVRAGRTQLTSRSRSRAVRRPDQGKWQQRPHRPSLEYGWA